MMKAVFFLLVGLLLATAVVAGPFGSRPSVVDEVQTECSDLTRFKPQNRYEFTYEATTQTGIQGAGPMSEMLMSCDVMIEVPERCKQVLKTTSCQLEQNPDFAAEMSAHDLVFITRNGRIVELLAHPDESVQILNAKRGILSLLQLDMEADDVDQTTLNDVSVHGNCTSEMKVTRRDNSDRPRKLEVVTDLNTCTLREGQENMTMWQTFQDVVFNTSIADKFINSSRMCKFDVKAGGEIKGATCNEVHSFWLMNFNSETGAQTRIQQTLINTVIDRLNTFPVITDNTRSTCMRYEHDRKAIGKKPDDVTADQAIAILKDLVKSTLDEVKMDSPRLFGRWRAALEGMNNETIHEVFDRAYNCSDYSQTCRDNPNKVKLAREYLLDGLLPCTTLSCFSVKNYAIAKGIVPRPLANAWMVSMAFQNYPTLELMSEMLRMAQAMPSQITIFPLSIMIHNFWVQNEELRTESTLPEPIANTIRYLKSILGSDCRVSAENERLALVALKAIGNIGEPVERFDQLTFSYSDKVSPVLISCSKNKQIPSDISKAAIQSMRRFVLSDELRRQVIDELFKQTNLDVPQRVAAFLIAMKANPSVSELTGIWTSLQTEPNNQIRAFCFSYIQNILESSEPTVQRLQNNLRKALVEAEIPDYPKDIRKNSRYFELSKNFTEPWRNNTLAFQFESDIIYKSDSYMPQEVMFHYVLNALGKSWDLFETGIEMRGFEPILESIFGPEGFFPEISLQNLFSNIDEKILAKVREFAEGQLMNTETSVPKKTSKPIFKSKDKYSKKALNKQPEPQQVAPEITQLLHENTMNKLNQLHNLVGMEHSATDVTLFLRLLGNEMGFVSASDILSIIPYTVGIVDELINKTKQIPQLLSQGLDFNTTRSFVFMDKTFIIPTGMGMPLNCSINGTAVVSLRIRSQFSINLPKIIAAGHIAPSGAVEVLATMGIDMPTKVFTGVMANSTVYHSSKIAGNITIDGTHLKINLNNTDRPMNLFNYSTTYNLLKANGDVEYLPGVTQDAVRGKKCSNVSRVFGVDLCVSWAYPNASYVADAPRFPFAGPNSFNVTLVNTDMALKAFTFDAQYKQIKEGGAPAPIPFGSLGKSRGKRSAQPVTKLIDTLRISFYAPGEELTRNITSFLSVDRLRKEVKWIFTVPEVKNFTMFAGILNETTDSRSAYRAVFNISGAENAASVDFLVRNDNTLNQKNLTSVFNASINSLYWAVVGQYLQQPETGDWNAHLTQTYYWDDETPLYKQLLFPWTDYAINHEKYQTAFISAMRQADGQIVDRNLQMGALNWVFKIDSRQTVTDFLKEFTFESQITNGSLEYRLLNTTLRNTTKRTGYRLEAEASRFTHHMFAEYDVTKEPMETNRNCRLGLRTDMFVPNPEASMFMNSPVLLKLFGETALIDEPIEIDGGINFRILDQSDQRAEQYLIQTNIFMPNPRSPQSHLTYDFELELENATLLNRMDYTIQLSTPIPLLKLTNMNLLHLVADVDAGTAMAEHFYTLYDTRYNKAHATISNSVSVGWKALLASWIMEVQTSSLSFRQNYTSAYNQDQGLQFFYETNQDSSLFDMLDFAEFSNFTLKPTAMSMHQSYVHQLLTSSVSQSFNLDGPITEMRPRLIPMIVRDVLNKTMCSDFLGIKDVVLNKIVYNITESSLTLQQSYNVSSPIVANMTSQHFLFLSASLFQHQLTISGEQRSLNITAGLDHSLEIQNNELSLKSKGNLTLHKLLLMKTLTSVNATLLQIGTPFDISGLHDTRITTPVASAITFSSVSGDVGTNKKLNLVANHNTSVASRFVSLEVVGNYNINDMSSLTYFEEMTGIMSYKLQSRMVKSSFNSSITFNTFRRLFKFQKVQGKLSHDIKSSIVNWTAQGQTLLQHFSNITQFGEISSNLGANLVTKLVNGSHSSGLALRNLQGLVQFDELTGHIRNNITSKIVNSSYDSEININNVESLVAFRNIDGASNYILTSRLLNVTANNTMQLSGFRSLFNFDIISGNQLWLLNTSPLNATMDNALTLRGFRKLFNFDEITARVSGNFTSYLANGTTVNTLSVQDVQSITTVAALNVESSSDFLSRLVNVSLSNEMSITNHFSLLNFERIMTTMNFTGKVLNMSASALNQLDLNGFTSLFVFNHATQSMDVKANSYYINTSMSEVISLEQFRDINQFDLASVEVISTVNTVPLNISYQQTHRIEQVQGWFVYPLAETVIMANITSRKLNVSGSYEGRIVNLQGPFNYESGLTKIEYGINNRFLNVTGFHGIEVNTMQGFLSFDRINGTSLHIWNTPVTELTIGGLLDLVNFRGLFQFDLINITTSNNFTVTPLTTSYALYQGGLSFSGFEKFNKFSDVQGFSRSAVLTKWTNWTTSVESRFSGFRSYLDFDSIAIDGKNEFTTPLFVMIANTTNSVIGSTGLFKARSANTNNLFSISSRIAKVDSGAMWSVNGLTGPLRFESNGMNGYINITTPVVSTGSLFNIAMNDWQNLTQFVKYEFNAAHDVVSRIAQWNVLSHFQIDNMAGILTYGRVEGSASSNFTSILSSLNSSVRAHINRQEGLLTFDELVVSSRANFTTWPAEVRSATDFNIHNMAGFMMYDSISSSASTNLTSKFLNATAQTNAVANTGNGLFKVQLANITSLIVVDTPVTKAIQASTTAQISNSRKLFNFDEAAMRSEYSFLSSMINISGNARSIFTSFENITNFESSEVTAEMEITNRFVNTSSNGVIKLLGFQRLFNFDKVMVGGLTSVKSCLANLTSEVGVEFANFDHFLAFERMNSTAGVNITSKFVNVSAVTGMEMINVHNLTAFERINGSFVSNLNATWVNFTSVSGFALTGFRSLFNFDKVEASAQSILTNKLINATAMADYTLTDSTCYCRFDKLVARSAGSFYTKLATGNAVGSFEIHDAQNSTKFDLVNATVAGRFNTKLASIVGEAVYSIKNQRWLFNFDEVSSRVYGNIRSKWLNGTALMESQLTNSYSFFGFDAAKSLGSVNVQTPFGEAYFHTQLNMTDFTNITHYASTSALITADVTSPVVNSRAYVRLNITDMAGFMTFGKIETEAFSDVESRFVNSTYQNALLLQGFQGLQYSAIGHRFNFRWVDPINDLVVKNGLDMHNLQDLVQAFNITWVNPKGTILVSQNMNYENLIASIKVPSIGVITAGANLNTIGDTLVFYVDHQLKKDNLKNVNDITWLLKLNQSNVLYSNFSWNPETVSEIVEVTVGAINSTFNRTITIANNTINRIMEVANRTLTHTRRMTNCTKCFMRYSMMLVNETVNATLTQLNQTLYEKMYELNQTLYIKFSEWNQTVRYALNNPREILEKYINVSRLNQTVIKLNETLMALYTNLRHNITNPKETFENIKMLIKYEQRRDQIQWMIKNRQEVMHRVKEFILELKANATTQIKAAITDLKERTQYDAKVEALMQYVEARFNVPKMQEKIEELKVKMTELKQKMAELREAAGERVHDLKTKIATLDKATVKAAIQSRIEIIKDFIMYYLNSTTIDAIKQSIFIDYRNDAQVQDLLRKFIRIRPRHVIDIIDRQSISETKEQTILKLQKLNQTLFRFANRTYINETFLEGIEMAKVWNATFHEYVYVDVIEGDLKLVLNMTKQQVINITKAAVDFAKNKTKIIKAFLKETWDARPKSVEELKEQLTEIKTMIVEYIQEKYTIDVNMIAERVVSEYLKRKENITMLVNEIIAISKNETHPVNMLPLCYFNKTIYQIVQPPVNMTLNLTMVYGKMAMNLTEVYGKMAFNFTKVYSGIALERSITLGKKYVPLIKKAVQKYKGVAIQQSQILKEKAQLYFNYTKGNVTVLYLKYAPIVNETIRNYTCLARDVLVNYTIQVRNMTATYINMTIDILEPHVGPYREIAMQKYETVRLRAVLLKERVRQLPAQTEEYLMQLAEYHIDRYPQYKEKVIELKANLTRHYNELKANLTRHYNELKANLTRLYGELKENATELYERYSSKAWEIYDNATVLINGYKMKVEKKWQTYRPIMQTKALEFLNATKLRINQTLESVIDRSIDEYSLINELPMRAMDKTIYQLTMELKEYIKQLVEDTKLSLKDRQSFINKYPVMYLDMTVVEIGNFTFDKVLFATNLTKFYTNKTVNWANATLIAANQTIYEAFVITNQTVRDVIIPYINETALNLVSFLNRTRFQPWNTTLNETLVFLNKTSIVLMNKANETFIVMKTKAIEAWNNVTSEESIAKMKLFLNKTKDMVFEGIRVANETVFMLRNRSTNFIIYLRDETPLINLTKEYVFLAKNLTRDAFYNAKNISLRTVCYTQNVTKSIATYVRGPAYEYTMEYVTYINNTMPGWFIRYYEIDRIPSRVSECLAAIEPVELARNLTAYAINRTRLITDLALNRTQVMAQIAFNETTVLTKRAINRTRTLIRDTLNTIGRLDDHSFAMNISHPFNWTSFRSFPRLNNSQIEFIKDKMMQLNQTIIIPMMNKIEELRVNVTERYNNISRMVVELYEQKKPIVMEKIEKLRTKLEEKFEEYKELLNEYKQQLHETWNENWKPFFLEKERELVAKWENEIKPKLQEFVNNSKAFINDPELLTKLKEKALYIKEEYIPDLKRRIIEEEYPRIKRIVFEEYEVAKSMFEEFKRNVTIYRQQLEVKIDEFKTKVQEKWNELLERIEQFKENWPEKYQEIKEKLAANKEKLRTMLDDMKSMILAILRDLRIPIETLPLEHINIYSPWKYTAMIFGENHVMTFDGKVYSVPQYVSEQQTYVLAHDFIDRNFTLLAQKKRITLLVRNMSVAIDDENIVYINGLPVYQELPHQTPYSKELTIMREGPWVNVTSTKGIAIACHKDHFLCILHLSGWYHGRSRGLLGNLDTEHHNELITPEGDIVTDLSAFISSYDVSPYPLSRNVIPSSFGACASRIDQCTDLFLNENSILKNAFSVINRTEFYNLCVDETRRCHRSCEASDPVVALGKDMGLNVSYESSCLDCTLGEETPEPTRATRGADIIFVVSETSSMGKDNELTGSMESLISRINTKLSSYSVNDVKYGLAAFGGKGIHGKPHSHTLGGKLQMTDYEEASVRSGIANLEFEGVQSGDAMQAIQFAASYPFRHEAAKIINLIVDNDLTEESGQPWDYLFSINTSLSAMKKMLERQGIILNVFSSYPTLSKDTTETPVLGVNYLGKQVIRKKNSGEENADRLAIPEGQYTKLAKATRGSIFGLRWLQNRHLDMMYMFPKVIWKQIQPQSDGSVDYNCRCVIGVYGEGRTECEITRFIDGSY